MLMPSVHKKTLDKQNALPRSFFKQRIVYFLPWTSSDTVNFLRPFARREANTRRPLAVCIRWRKPCLLFLLRLWGWNVLFIFVMLFFCFWYTYQLSGKGQHYHCYRPHGLVSRWGTFLLRGAKLWKLLWLSKKGVHFLHRKPIFRVFLPKKVCF